MLFSGPAGGRCPAGQEGLGGAGMRRAGAGQAEPRAPGFGTGSQPCELPWGSPSLSPRAYCRCFCRPGWMPGLGGGRGSAEGGGALTCPGNSHRAGATPAPCPFSFSCPCPGPRPRRCPGRPDPLRPLAWQLAPEAAWLLIRVRDGPVHVLNATNCF